MSDIIFVDGIKVSRAEKAPEFVIASLSIKVPELVLFLEKNQNNAGYVNVQIKKSKAGNLYCDLDTWKPDNKPVEKPKENLETIEYPEEKSNPEDIPF